jgi:hypothetical protein
LLYAFDKMRGTAITQIVAIHRSNHDVAQAHGVNSPGEIGRFGRIERIGPAVPDIAKRATPGTDISHDHEGGGTFRKAFAQVGAGGFLADRVQAVLPQARLELLDAIAGRRLGPNPGRLALHILRRYHLDRDARDLIGALELNSLHYLVFLHLGFQ